MSLVIFHRIPDDSLVKALLETEAITCKVSKQSSLLQIKTKKIRILAFRIAVSGRKSRGRTAKANNLSFHDQHKRPNLEMDVGTLISFIATYFLF